MKITLMVVGKTDNKHFIASIKEYVDRLSHYIPFSILEIPDIKNSKNLSEEQQKEKEGALILSNLDSSDDVILLDDKGSQYTSVEFSEFLNKKMCSGVRRLVFVVGGPYGFSKEVYDRANGKCSLSKLTFSHQMVRLIFVEQVYRAMTILKGEPYHHE